MFFKEIVIKHIKILLAILFIAIFGIYINKWVLSSNNFFYSDDLGWFLYSKNHSWLSYLNFFPTQMYDDRPVGYFIIKFLFTVFGYNNVNHHWILLLLHIVNSILLFLLTLQLPIFKKNKQFFFAFLCSIIFVSWNQANFAIQWDIGILEILSCTFTILFLILFTHFIKSKNNISLIGCCLLYFLSLRTKESNLFLPFLALFISLFLYSKPFTLIKKTIPIFIIFIVYFFLLFFLAVKTNFQNLNSFTEYQYSFSPVIFLRNYIRFFYIYFDIKNLNWIFLSYDKTLTIFFLFFAGTIFYLYKQKKIKLKTIMIFFICIFFSLFLVLPLTNSLWKKYLYVPSIFFAMLLSYFSIILFNNKTYVLIFWVCFLLYLNMFNKASIAEQNYWKTVGKENKKAFKKLLSLNIPKNKCVVVYGANKTANIFNGYGSVIQLLHGNRDVFMINRQENNLRKDCFIIDYRDFYKNKFFY